MSTLDLAAEKDIREGFEKRATFNVVPSLSKADFVFLCITEYKENVKARVLLNVLAIALRPDDFKTNRSDLTQLRDFALWQSARSAKVRVKFKSVMDDFHDFAMKKWVSYALITPENKSMNQRLLTLLIFIAFSVACSSEGPDGAASKKELTIKIKAAIVYKMGGPQPVARTTFYLSKESLISLARKAGKNEDIGVLGAMANYETQLDGSSKTIEAFVKPAALSTVTTDFEGNGSFKNLAPGTYYLIGVAQTRSGVAIWNTPVTPGDETILIDQHNAAYTS